MSKEIQTENHIYRIGQLSAMDQFHLSRRLAPIVPTLGPLLSAVAGGLNTGSAGELVSILPSLQPFADALAALPDEQAEYVINACLSVTSRKTGTGWAAVRSHGQTMLDDLTLQEMMQITIRVIQDNLGPFIKGLLTKESGQPLTPDLPA